MLDGRVREHGVETNLRCILQTPDGKYLAVVDLAVGRVIIYDKKLMKKLDTSVLKGHGTRHLSFSNDGKLPYCVSELCSVITFSAYWEGRCVNLYTQN